MRACGIEYSIFIMATPTIKKKTAAQRFSKRWETLKKSIDERVEALRDGDSISDAQIENAKAAHAELVTFVEENRIQEPVIYLEIMSYPDPDGPYGFVREYKYAFPLEFMDSATIESMPALKRLKKAHRNSSYASGGKIARWAARNARESLLKDTKSELDTNKLHAVKHYKFQYYD